MADRGYKYRKEWNASNYNQIKADVPPETATAFKAACRANNEPVRQVLIGLMEEYSRLPMKAKKVAAPDYSTRAKRRKATAEIFDQLMEILEAEEAYKDAIPENLQGSKRYDAAEKAVDSLNEAIAAIEDAFTDA
jgi:hypothetical protein